MFAFAELDGGEKAVAAELQLSQQTVKNHLMSARNKAGCHTTIGLYHRLVRGVRFETHVTTRVVVEEN